jgi:hypothetical protein
MNDDFRQDTSKDCDAMALAIEVDPTLEERLRGLEKDAAEIKIILRAILAGIDRINARLPALMGDSWIEVDDTDEGFLTPAAGQFLH